MRASGLETRNPKVETRKMTAEGLKRAVLERAGEEAEKIIAEAREKAGAIMESARKEAEGRAAEILSKASRESEEEARRELGRIERELRLEMLREKNRMVEEVLDHAAERFRNLSQTELTELFRSEVEGLDLAGAIVRVPRGMRGCCEPFAAAGADIGEDDSLDGGYVIEHEDFRLDRSLAARMNEIRAGMKTELARMLFEEEP